MGKEISVTITINENDEMFIKSILNEKGVVLVLSQAITSIMMGKDEEDNEVKVHDELQ